MFLPAFVLLTELGASSMMYIDNLFDTAYSVLLVQRYCRQCTRMWYQQVEMCNTPLLSYHNLTLVL